MLSGQSDFNILALVFLMGTYLAETIKCSG